MVEGQRGSAALLTLAGGGLALLIALVVVVTVADLVLSRGQAHIAADAAALAAVNATLVADPFGAGSAVAAPDPDLAGSAAAAAAQLARANGADLVECCGHDPTRRQVAVAVAPRSSLLRLVVPHARARAAAALVAAVPGLSPADALDGEDQVNGGGAGRLWPVAGRISSGFGMRAHPLRGTSRLHAGLDLAAAAGTPIRAAAAGVVVTAGWRGGYGYAVDLRHPDGVITRYAHQSRLLVRARQRVAAAQVIGLVGSTGDSTGPHLHFEVRTASGPIDPRRWLPHD